MVAKVSQRAYIPVYITLIDEVSRSHDRAYTHPTDQDDLAILRLQQIASTFRAIFNGSLNYDLKGSLVWPNRILTYVQCERNHFEMSNV